MNKKTFYFTLSTTLDEYSYSEFEDFSKQLTDNSILYIMLASSSGGIIRYLNNIKEILVQLKVKNIEEIMIGKYFVFAYFKLFITADDHVIDKTSWEMLHFLS